MNAYLYLSAALLRALTMDEAGANLPTDLGPWALDRMVTLHGGSPDEDEAVAPVQEHGFCCFN